MEETIGVGVILASVRQGRRGEAFAKWTMGLLAARPGVSAELLDLREHALPAYAYPAITPKAELAYTDPIAKRWVETIGRLDAFIVVTPEYNHGYPGSLKNALDHVYAGWNRKPVAFVGYGGNASGARAVEQLRLVAIELRMVPVRDEVNLRLIGFEADENGFPKDPAYARRAEAMINDLSWWARVTKAARAARG